VPSFLPLTVRRTVVRIVEVVQAQGLVEFVSRQRHGVRLRALLSGRFARVRAGVRLRGYLLTRFRQSVGVVIRARASGLIRSGQRSALKLGGRWSGRAAQQEPSLRIVETRVALTRRAGATTVTDEGPQTFTNPNNASGRANNVSATRNGQAVTATSSALRFAYADTVAKSSLTMTTFTLQVWLAVTGDALAQTTTTIQYRFGSSGPWTTRTSFTGDAAYGDYGGSILAQAGATGWANVDALEVRVLWTAPAGTALAQIAVDSAEYRIVANRTESY
jgi:hypothetical protein